MSTDALVALEFLNVFMSSDSHNGVEVNLHYPKYRFWGEEKSIKSIDIFFDQVAFLFIFWKPYVFIYISLPYRNKMEITSKANVT